MVHEIVDCALKAFTKCSVRVSVQVSCLKWVSSADAHLNGKQTMFGFQVLAYNNDVRDGGRGVRSAVDVL